MLDSKAPKANIELLKHTDKVIFIHMGLASVEKVRLIKLCRRRQPVLPMSCYY